VIIQAAGSKFFLLQCICRLGIILEAQKPHRSDKVPPKLLSLHSRRKNNDELEDNQLAYVHEHNKNTQEESCTSHKASEDKANVVRDPQSKPEMFFSHRQSWPATALQPPLSHRSCLDWVAHLPCHV
jgi:hypothetical protein